MPRRTSDDVADVLGRARASDAAIWECLVARLSVLPWSVARAHRLPGADCADVVQSTSLRLQETVLTHATRVIDVLNLSLGCFDSEPDFHLVTAHLVEQLHVTPTTSGPSLTRMAQRQSPPGRCTAAGRADPARPCRLPSSPVRSLRRWTKKRSPPSRCCARDGSPATRRKPACRRCRSYGQWLGTTCSWKTRPRPQPQRASAAALLRGAAHVPPSVGRWEACLRPHWTEGCAAPATCRQTGAGARRSGRRAAGRRSR